MWRVGFLFSTVLWNVQVVVGVLTYSYRPPQLRAEDCQNINYKENYYGFGDFWRNQPLFKELYRYYARELFVRSSCYRTYALGDSKRRLQTPVKYESGKSNVIWPQKGAPSWGELWDSQPHEIRSQCDVSVASVRLGCPTPGAEWVDKSTFLNNAFTPQITLGEVKECDIAVYLGRYLQTANGGAYVTAREAAFEWFIKKVRELTLELDTTVYKANNFIVTEDFSLPYLLAALRYTAEVDQQDDNKKQSVAEVFERIQKLVHNTYAISLENRWYKPEYDNHWDTDKGKNTEEYKNIIHAVVQKCIEGVPVNGWPAELATPQKEANEAMELPAGTNIQEIDSSYFSGKDLQ